MRRSIVRTVTCGATALALILGLAGSPSTRASAQATLSPGAPKGAPYTAPADYAQVATQAVVAPAPMAERLRAVAEEGLETSGAPGLAAAVAVADRLVWNEGFGIADVEHDAPVRADTVFRIASISKPIAATALLQLVERGRVSLDDPIQKHVPAFPQKGEQTITIRHLLTHTSGIRHYKDDEFNQRLSYDSIEDAIAIFKDDPLLFTPGTKYSYSTYAYNLVAGVVERASGLTFEEYLREQVWTPAGMTATRLEHPEEIVKGRARPYVRGGGASGRLRNAPMADLSIKWAGGGMISTAADLIRFHVALDEGKLLQPETLEQMYTPGTLVDGRAIEYGLGWFIIAKPPRPEAQTARTAIPASRTDGLPTPWIAHSGGATGGTTYLLRNPQAGLAVAILTNVQNAPGLQALAFDLARAAVPASHF